MSGLVSIELIEDKIFVIRGQKVMLDSDLALLYGVETKRLNEAVGRNIGRFPEKFMFELNQEEWDSLRSQFATSKQGKGGRRYLPKAFTEHGVLMLANVLNSQRAINVSIQIVDVFVKLRQLALTPIQEVSELKKLLLLYMEKTDAKLEEHDQNFAQIIQVLNNLLDNPREPEQIGFRTSG